ncbi:hypothetical protein [Flavobacterium sp. 25HG05S-40]|uniref:hypothetical protein n=1 Tax=Flavobacterium sp. 25HG05S-40 TaxID=3458682 RepID=UPI004044292B
MKILNNIIGNWKWYQKLRKQRKVAETEKDVKQTEEMKSLVIEYNLIQEKKSTLSRRERDRVENKIAGLIASGKLQVIIK